MSFLLNERKPLRDLRLLLRSELLEPVFKLDRANQLDLHNVQYIRHASQMSNQDYPEFPSGFHPTELKELLLIMPKQPLVSGVTLRD